ncbi:hypothetical protein IG631_09752 [Alternaria alternata]|nr:hypothetical protein IG631_09752 [Alternaria alternata]
MRANYFAHNSNSLSFGPTSAPIAIDILLGHDTRPFVLGAYVEPRIDERHDVETLAALVILINAWLEPGTLDSFNSFNASYTPALPTFDQPQLLRSSN